MPMVPAGVARETEIAEAVADVERSLASDVVHIRYEIGTDWSGDWAVFFRVLLSDEAGERRLRDVATKVVSRLADHLDFGAPGLPAYHNFRSESEQSVLREEAWA
jgi:hypothetical protein